MKRCYFLAVFQLAAVLVYSQKVSIIPEPRQVTSLGGSFVITPQTRMIVSDKNAWPSVTYLNDYLAVYYHLKIAKKATGKGSNTIVLRLSPDYPDSTTGAYSLHCSGDSLVITSRNPEGIFYGIQTLIQLLPVAPAVANALPVPTVEVTDAPRFAYRGMMLDVGRHFMPVDFVKKFIDYLALHKMNVFHWHLTEDQGWRIQIKKYPKLTEVGAWRNGTLVGHYSQTNKTDSIRTGGFYTQTQIREIVKYAAARYISIIPEIEMPGHSSAAIAAYPQLSCFPDSATDTHNVSWSGPETGKQVQQSWGVFKDVYAPTPYTFHFIEDVLDEVMKLFPSKYIHIGGDECPKIYWKESAYCQDLMKQEGLKNEEALQSYFIGKIEQYVNSKGRAIIGWDEILEGGLAPNATVMSWRGEQGGVEAAKMGHNVIMSPGGMLYLTHSQIKPDDSLTAGGYLPVSKIYGYDPVGKLDAATQKYVIGAESCLWTEYMKSPAKVEYMMFPRVAAVSEVFWSDPKVKDYGYFISRLGMQIERYKLWQVNYCKEYGVQ
jgi:hexosaminidase